ncbi:MAG: hypothetical protein AAB899_02720 [Patescibacteria group bacterium]
MPENIKKSEKLPPLRNDSRAVLNARNSLPASGVTPELSREELLKRLDAEGTQNSRKLARALRGLYQHVDEKKNPQKNLNFDNEK